MSKMNGAGHSWVTADKQAGLAIFLAQHIAIAGAVIAKHGWASDTYHYIDANAGPGAYPDWGLDGSPVVFLKLACQSSIRFYAHLIEADKETARSLWETIGPHDFCKIHASDNKAILPIICAESIRVNSYGLLYHDPNGQPDYDLLHLISVQPKLKFIDVLIRYNATAVKRNLHNEHKRLLDYLVCTGKQYWLIRTVLPGDAWNWTFLFGTNYKDFKPWTNKGFIRLDSPDGIDLFERLNYKQQERREKCQLNLFRDNQPIEPTKNILQRLNSKLSEAG
jgi:hypothetical protein